MPSKPELEATVANLEVKLAAAEAKLAAQPVVVLDPVATASAVAAVNSDLSDLEKTKLADDLIAERKVTAALQLDVDGLKAELDIQLAVVKSVGDERDNANALLTDVRDRLFKKTAELAELEVKLAAKQAKPVVPDKHLLLEGVLHRVVKHERVADLCEQWKKQFVDGNDIALLVTKA